MALVECPDCGTSISDRALACVKCGAPVEAAPHAPRSRVVTTQQTGKRYKGAQLIGAGMLIVGIVVGMANQPLFGGLLGALGLAVYLLARIGAWWNHA
jgi:hypothetical protein